MLQIPVKLNLEAGEAVEALKKFEKGAEDAIKEIVDLNGKKINVDFKFSVSGDPVVKELNEQEVAIKKVEKAYDKLTGGQERSIGRTRKQIKQFKEERDKLDVTSRAYREKAAQVKKYEDRLRKLSFVQKGSITDLKAQRQGLIEARDAASIGSVKFQDLSKQISELDKELGRATPKANTFVKALAISLSTVLRLIVKLKIGLPPTILLVKPPNIDFKIEGTPGRQNTFSTLNPGAPLVGFKIKFAFSGIQTIFCLPSLNSPGL